MRPIALLASTLVLMVSASAMAEDWFGTSPPPNPLPNQSSQAIADAMAVSPPATCPTPATPPPAAKKKAVGKKKLVAKPTPPPPPPCVCEDAKCEPCAAPVIVTKVETKTVYVDRPVLVQPEPYKAQLWIGLGYFFDGAVPAHYYMWQQGPDVQLRLRLTPSYDVFLNVGAGMGAQDSNGPGHWRSFRAQAGLDAFSKKHPWVGLSASLYASNVGFSAPRDSEVYVAGVPGLAFRVFSSKATRDGKGSKGIALHVQTGLMLGVGIGQKTEFAIGPVMSAHLNFNAL